MKKIAILKETINGENRVILLPNDIDELTKKYEVYVETGAGKALGFSDSDYKKHGAIIKDKEYCCNNNEFI